MNKHGRIFLGIFLMLVWDYVTPPGNQMTIRDWIIWVFGIFLLTLFGYFGGNDE